MAVGDGQSHPRCCHRVPTIGGFPHQGTSRANVANGWVHIYLGYKRKVQVCYRPAGVLGLQVGRRNRLGEADCQPSLSKKPWFLPAACQRNLFSGVQGETPEEYQAWGSLGRNMERSAWSKSETRRNIRVH